MAIVGTTDSVAEQGTAQLMAMASTRCPPVVHDTGTCGTCDGAAEPHKERHDRFALQADFGHGAVKQEGEAGQITGFLHQIEAKGDAQHEGRHHQCEKQHIDQHITNQGNQQPMDMNLFHSGAQNIAQRRQYCRCDTRYNTGEDHRQQENQQDDAESQQLSPNGRKRPDDRTY